MRWKITIVMFSVAFLGWMLSTNADAKIIVPVYISRHLAVKPSPKPHVWILPPEEEQYKTDRVAYYQGLLIQRGITNLTTLRMASAQLWAENGAFSESRDGDHGCSIGIPQRNTCILLNPLTKKYFKSALEFRKVYPAWLDAKTQLNWMADRFVENMQKFDGNAHQLRLALLTHNCPNCAFHGAADSSAGYVSKIKIKAASMIFQ